MTYVKCTSSKVKVLTTVFWLLALVLVISLAPTLVIAVAILAMFNAAYLMISPVPLPIVLSFVCMVSLSFYAVYMSTTPII